MADTLPSLQILLDDITSEYQSRYANQSRFTRDLDGLDELITRIRAVLVKAKSVADASDLIDRATATLEMYQEERKQIVEAKKSPPEMREFAVLGNQANFVFARYRRHFAGQSRNTRDLGMLAEMVDDLTKIEKRMKDIVGRRSDDAMKKDLEVVRENIKMYSGERGQILEARTSGTAEEQAGLQAELANNQFAVYREHFAGQSRLTRRPQLLTRIVENLKQVKDRMTALKKAGLKLEQNDGNIGIVDNNLQLYITELSEIRKARATVKLVDLMGELGTAANNAMTEYRDNFAGMDRRTRDLGLLSKLCDQLGEALRQMGDLGRAEPNDMNTQNQQITTDNLSMLESEWGAIYAAKQPIGNN